MKTFNDEMKSGMVILWETYHYPYFATQEKQNYMFALKHLRGYKGCYLYYDETGAMVIAYNKNEVTKKGIEQINKTKEMFKVFASLHGLPYLEKLEKEKKKH